MLFRRYRGIVDADPRETFAFQRLLDLYRERDGSLDPFFEELRAEVDANDEAYAPRMLLAHLHRGRGQLAEARELYAAAVALRPREPAPLAALARLERDAQPEEARRLLERALENTRERLDREPLLRELAELALDADDLEAARAHYQQLGRGQEGGVYLRTELARALSERGRHALAVEEYRRVLRSLRGDNRVLPPVLLELARAELAAGEIEVSLETLDRAIRLAGPSAGIRAELYDQLLETHRRANRLPELAERLRREGTRSFDAAVLLGRVADELGDDDEALEAYGQALRRNPRHVETRLRVIQILGRSGRLDEVVDAYRSLIRASPREPRFVIELAQLLVQTDRRSEALTLVRDAARRSPRDVALHQQLAELYARWGEDELAARQIELLARIDPTDPSHLIALGSQQLQGGDRAAAIATWRRMLGIERGARGHASLGAVLADHDLLEEAEREYREAIRLEPDELDFARGLASVLERQNSIEEAEEAWRRVVALSGDDRGARREGRERIVGLWVRSRRLPDRLRDLEGRFRAEPPDLEAGRTLAEAHRRRGPEHLASAEAVLARLVELAPGDVESLSALERLRTQRGDRAGAIEVLARLREADARRASHYLQRMAEHALALYRDDEAIGYAAQAVEQNPDDASAHRRLGDLYRARQDVQRAMSSYRRALELNERLYPVYFELAELHTARGESQRASRLYREVLQITPDDDLVVRAARAALQAHLGAETLLELERDLLPLALENPTRPVFRRMVVELYEAYGSPLVRALARGGSAGESARAALEAIGPRALKPLLEALADRDPSQRRVALDLLGHLGQANAAGPLLSLAEGSHHELGQRMQALRAAAQVAGPEHTPRLRELADRGDRPLRSIAASALSRVGGSAALEAARALVTSGDPAVRGIACMTLAELGEPADAERVRVVAESDLQEEASLAAIWALGRFGDEAHAGPLARLARTRGGLVAEVAVDALGRIGGEVARAALVEALFDPDAALRSAAARALSRPADLPEPARPPLAPFERVREHVVGVIARAEADGDGRWVDAIETLAPLIEPVARVALEGPAERALAALSILGSRPGGLGLGPLTAGMHEWEPARRAALEASLRRLGASLAPALSSAAREGDAAVAVEAARVLARLDDEPATTTLGALLGAAAPEVRRAALDALADAARPLDDDTGARVAALLDHRDWSIRTRAARALGAASAEVGLLPLTVALGGDGYAFVREAAARSLRAHPTDPRARDALLAALRADPEVRVRLAAFGALEAAGGDAAEEARTLARDDPDPTLRERAVERDPAAPAGRGSGLSGQMREKRS